MIEMKSIEMIEMKLIEIERNEIDDRIEMNRN